MNRKCRLHKRITALNPEIDTMFFTTSLEYAFLELDDRAKEVASYGSDVSHFVPASC